MSHGVNQPFDLAAHQRERIRTLERDNQHLTTQRARLERILAITLKVAAGQDCEPRTLLQAIYELERAAWLDGTLATILTDERIERLLDATAAA